MKKRTLGKLLSAVLTAAMLLSLVPAALAAEAGETHITILGTSDMHGNIWGYSYEDDKDMGNNGMSRLYTYIQQVRAENPNTFLIDAGDDIQGTILTDDLYNKTPDEPHPVIAAMNFMGYDAMTPGNHEFNWGIPTMLKILGQAEFPVLGSNLLDKDGRFVTGAGWTIVERGGVKVAVIGAVNPDAPIWDGGKEGIDDLTYEAANTAVKKAIAEIGDQADVIVVSAHLGMYAEFDEENGSDSAQKILDDNPEIDVLQVAHNHVVVNDRQGNTVIGGVRNSGRDIARFDLTLDADNNVIDSKVEIVDMAGVEPSQAIRELPLVAESHQKTIDFIKGGGSGEDGGGGAALGSTTARFQPDNEFAGLPQGKLEDTAVMDLINKVQLENSGADVSAAALFKDTSDLPAGDINYGNIFDIYKFDNTLYRVTVTGAELKAYMEWSAECYNQWVPGDINISLDPEYPRLPVRHVRGRGLRDRPLPAQGRAHQERDVQGRAPGRRPGADPGREQLPLLLRPQGGRPGGGQEGLGVLQLHPGHAGGVLCQELPRGPRGGPQLEDRGRGPPAGQPRARHPGAAGQQRPAGEPQDKEH